MGYSWTIGATMARHGSSPRAANGDGLDAAERRRHVISMRHCHAKEEEIWQRRMG
jgi:hypothetical protein